MHRARCCIGCALARRDRPSTRSTSLWHRYTYDAAQRLASVIDARNIAIESYQYDDGDRLTSTTDAPGVRSELINEYDTLDRRIKRTVLINGQLAEETMFGYDDANRLTRQTHRAPGAGQNVPQTVSYVWDASNRLTEKTLPNGIKQIFTHDAADRLTELRYAKSDSTPIETFTSWARRSSITIESQTLNFLSVFT